jgi:hypothetical protein
MSAKRRPLVAFTTTSVPSSIQPIVAPDGSVVKKWGHSLAQSKYSRWRPSTAGSTSWFPSTVSSSGPEDRLDERFAHDPPPAQVQAAGGRLPAADDADAPGGAAVHGYQHQLLFLVFDGRTRADAHDGDQGSVDRADVVQASATARPRAPGAPLRRPRRNRIAVAPGATGPRSSGRTAHRCPAPESRPDGSEKAMDTCSATATIVAGVSHHVHAVGCRHRNPESRRPHRAGHGRGRLLRRWWWSTASVVVGASVGGAVGGTVTGVGDRNVVIGVVVGTDRGGGAVGVAVVLSSSRRSTMATRAPSDRHHGDHAPMIQPRLPLGGSPPPGLGFSGSTGGGAGGGTAVGSD